ncbi:hypothetical protein [Amycolatopsis sp. cg9]|uniref:hypothetical protein n=1 Tax=Amycolatopsis sp. cg9 TaxID=3238801 RepID=UPI00352608D7
MIQLRIGLWRAWAFVQQRPLKLTVGIFLLIVEILVPRSASFWILVGLTIAVAAKELIDISEKVYKDLKKILTIESKLRQRPLQLPYKSPYDSWEKIEFEGSQAVHDPVLDAELTTDPFITLEKQHKMWRPPSAEHETVRKLKVPTLDFDEDKVRLESDLEAGITTAKVRRTTYSAFLVTNRLALYEYREHHAAHEYLEFPDLGPDGRGPLPRLPLSTCSNHIGADVLAISEGRLLLQRQANKNIMNGGLIIGSGSGSADWQDLVAEEGRRRSRPEPPPRCRDLCSFVKYTMWREMVEEMGLRGDQRHGPENIKIIGYCRVTAWGGKPQFYGVASLGPVEPKVRGMERRYVDDQLAERFDPKDGVPGLLGALDAVERRYGSNGELAFPLYITIQLLRQWLHRDAPAAAAWLKLG